MYMPYSLLQNNVNASLAIPQSAYLTPSVRLQLSVVAVELVAVPAVRVGIGILPERIIGPAALRGARGRAPASHVERIRLGKGIGVSSAFLPPRGAGVEGRVPTGCRMVGVGEGLDPGHRLAIRFEIKHCRDVLACVCYPVLRCRGITYCPEELCHPQTNHHRAPGSNWPPGSRRRCRLHNGRHLG